MKNSLLFALLFVPVLVQAQFLNSMTISPTPTVECSTTVVTLNGSMGCINGMFNGTTLNIVGTNIFVSLDVSQPPICLPAISNITGSANLTNLTPGTYTVIGQYVENGNVTATLTQSLVVGSCCSVNPGIINSTTSICAGDSITFTAADPTLTSINWKLDGTSIGSSGAVTETFMMPGTYTISMIGDDGSCVDSSSQIITVGDFPTINFTPTDEGCPGKADGSIMALVTSASPPPVTFSWSTGSTSQNLTGIAAGTYVLTATSSIGCATTDSVTISAGPSVTAAFMASDSLICAGDTVTFTNMSSGGQANLWYVNGILSSATPDFQTSIFTNPINTVKLVSLSATCEDSVETTINISQKPSFQATINNPTCPASSDGDIALSITPLHPPYSILWSGGTSGPSLSQIPGGTYSFQLTDSLGCVFADSVTVVPDSGIVASFTASDTGIVCLGSSITLSNTTLGSPALDWWVNGTSIGTTSTEMYLFADTGTYVISLLVADGVCTDTAEIQLLVPSLPSVDAVITGEGCPGNADGMIDLTPLGGIAPYSYVWSNSETTEDLSGLAPGEYSLSITDSEGCTSQDTFIVENVGAVGADFTFTTNSTFLEYMFQDLSTNAASWSWDFGDGVGTSMLQNPTYTYTFGGVYEMTLIATSPQGCVDTVKKVVEVGGLSIEDQLIHILNISPNPTNSLINIDLSPWQGRTADITIIDASGRMVLRKALVATSSSQIDLSHLGSGIYSVLVEVDGEYGLARIKKD